MIWVLTSTLSQASPSAVPASLLLLQLYSPSSVDRTVAMSRDPSSRIWIRPEKLSCPPGQQCQLLSRSRKLDSSPLKNQVMLGAGAPSAVHEMVASLPSRAVKFDGGEIRIGTEAENDDCVIVK